MGPPHFTPPHLTSPHLPHSSFNQPAIHSQLSFTPFRHSANSRRSLHEHVVSLAHSPVVLSSIMSQSSGAAMTPKLLQQICRSLDLYQTAELNDKLYLHYKGFTHIAHLQPYSGLKVLYLEGNALSSLAGLESQSELRCLYVQENSLEGIDSLCVLPQLSTLNASTNFIHSLPTSWSLVDRLPRLHTLSLQNNRLASVDSLQSLRGHTTLAVLDLQHNRLESHTGSEQQQQTEAEEQFEALLALLHSLPQLRVLYLKGNPMLSKLSNYRKRTLAALPELTYLDERPVFDEERRLVAAWHRGGLEEEREEKGRMRREERDKERRQWELFDKLVNDAASEREEKEHDELAKRANNDSRQEQKQPQPQSEPVRAVAAAGSDASGWEEKEQLSEAVEDGLILEDGQRVGRASGRQHAMHAWQSAGGSGAAKQTKDVPVTKLELGARGRSGAAQRGSGSGMLIELIEDDIDP